MVLPEKGNVETEKHEGEGQVKAEMETGDVYLQAKECQGLLANTRSYEEEGKILS